MIDTSSGPVNMIEEIEAAFAKVDLRGHPEYAKARLLQAAQAARADYEEVCRRYWRIAQAAEVNDGDTATWDEARVFLQQSETGRRILQENP